MYFSFKRILDVFFSVVLLILSFPAFLAISILIFIEDLRFPFYFQQRIGKNGQKFVMYKFRSMKIGTPSITTEEMQRLGLKPYTKIGVFLRRTSLDELPQLVNVLIGNMSFIGPRPALPSQVQVLEARARAGVDCLLPGITGLAQVSGRDGLNDDEKTEFDVSYLVNLSFQQDFNILFLTMIVILSNRGNK